MVALNGILFRCITECSVYVLQEDINLVVKAVEDKDDICDSIIRQIVYIQIKY